MGEELALWACKGSLKKSFMDTQRAISRLLKHFEVQTGLATSFHRPSIFQETRSCTASFLLLLQDNSARK